MKQNHETKIPAELTKVYEALPNVCYFIQDECPSHAGKILKGDRQYIPMKLDRAMVDELNDEAGVSKEQERAMLTGSMFGWHVPGIDPKCYVEASQKLHDTIKEQNDLSRKK